jgi:hypothetical protein
MFRALCLSVCSWCVLMAADVPAVQAMKDELAKQVASAAADDKMKTLVKEKLIPLTTDAVWVAEVAAQNAKAVPLDTIKKIDVQWQKAEEELPIQQEMLRNACAKACNGVIAQLPMVKELFVMDNQGANVGQNALTSDYWQGDEDKWTKSFNAGKGGIDVGKVKFDKSSNVSTQQISLPIIAADGAIIGAVTFGIDVGAL